jgi:site-specific recombinase XerD
MISFYLRGINLIDLLRLTSSKNIAYDRLNFVRAKTRKEMSILLREEIWDLIKLFESTNDYVIPVYTEGLSDSTRRSRLNNLRKEINSGLKEISKDLNLGIGQRITYYSARHTYAMTLKRSKVPLSIISQGLGHAMEKTSKHYLDSFEDDILDDADKYLY